jgi:hypothetical protein
MNEAVPAAINDLWIDFGFFFCLQMWGRGSSGYVPRSSEACSQIQAVVRLIALRLTIIFFYGLFVEKLSAKPQSSINGIFSRHGLMDLQKAD